MDNNFKILLKKFDNIYNQGLITSGSNLKNGAGITFEKLLGETGGDFCYPDFKGIEIKVIRSYTDATIDLLSITPESKYLFTTQWLTEKYGYPDSSFTHKKCLKGDVYCNEAKQIGRNYKFKLKINRNEKKILLQVYTRGGFFLNEDVFWLFDDIKKRIETKLNKMAVISHHRYSRKNIYYYTYDKIELYTLKSFDNFINMIENGKVCISFKTGYYKSGKYIGKFHDHGTSFKINKENLPLVFNRIY